jgi:hypothetical protein
VRNVSLQSHLRVVSSCCFVTIAQVFGITRKSETWFMLGQEVQENETMCRQFRKFVYGDSCKWSFVVTLKGRWRRSTMNRCSENAQNGSTQINFDISYDSLKNVYVFVWHL